MKSKSINYVSWVLQVVLVLAIGGGGTLKLVGDPAMVTMFDDIGMGQWFRYLVGLLEVAGVIGLLIPRLRAAAAAGLLLLLLGATVTNVVVLDASAMSALVWALLAGAVLYLRRDELPSSVKG